MPSSGSASDGAVLLVWVLILVGFGLAGSSIWKKKGGSPGVGFALGFFLGLIGLLIAALATPSGGGRTSAVSGQTTASTSRPSIAWMRSGQRYMLGFMVEPPMYAIWDRTAPGPPTIRFPYTEHGKSEALKQFQELEPSGVEVAAVPTLPPAPAANAYGF